MSAGTGRLAPAAGVVEQVLEAAGPDGCIVLVEERSEAELRFANNTVTTNGTRRDRHRHRDRPRARSKEGSGVGIASRSGAGGRDRPSPSSRDDRRPAPRRRTTPLRSSPPQGRTPPATSVSGPVTTSLGGLGDVLAELGDAFGRARASGTRSPASPSTRSRRLPRDLAPACGFATCSRPASSRSSRASDDGSRSAWAGNGRRRPCRRAARGARGPPAPPARLGRAEDRARRRGATRS